MSRGSAGFPVMATVMAARWRIAAVLALLLAALLVLTGEPYQYRKAVSYLESRVRQGDLVLMDAAARSREPKLKGVRVRILREISARALRGRERIWLVEYRGGGLGTVPAEAKCKTEKRFGPYRVRLCEGRWGLRIAYHLVDGLPAATVTLGKGKKRWSCSFDRKGRCRFPCKRVGDCGPSARETKGWRFVSATVQPLKGVRRECVWAHPDNNYRLSVRYPTVPFDGGMEIAFGIADSGRHPTKPPLEVTIKAAGKLIHKERLAPVPSWKILRFPAGAKGTKGPLEISIFTPYGGGKHFCFTGVAFKPKR